MAGTRSLTSEVYNIATRDHEILPGENVQSLPTHPSGYYVKGTLDTGEVYHPLGAQSGTAMTTVALVANRILLTSWDTGRGGKVDSFAVRVTTGVANAKIRINIYELDYATLYPSKLWFVSDELDGSAAAVVTQAGLWTIPPGRLFGVGVQSGHTPTLRAHTSTNLYPAWGFDNTLGTAGQSAVRATFTYARAPEQFPKGATFLTATDIPAVFARFKH